MLSIINHPIALCRKRNRKGVAFSLSTPFESTLKRKPKLGSNIPAPEYEMFLYCIVRGLRS